MNPRMFPLIALLAFGSLSKAEEASPAPYQVWDKKIVTEFKSIPVTYQGRIRPLDTVATNVLYELSTKTSFSREAMVDGKKKNVKISAAEWLMDVLFRQDVARDHPVFIVDDSNAVVSIQATPKRKRDSYSYNELFATGASREKLGMLANGYQTRMSNKEEHSGEKLAPLEEQILLLGKRVRSFENVAGSTLPVMPDALGPGATMVGFLKDIPPVPMVRLRQLLEAGPGALGSLGADGQEAFAKLFRIYSMYASSDGIMFFPPKEADKPAWESPAALIQMAVESQENRPWALDRLGKLEKLVAVGHDQAAFGKELTAFNQFVRSEAQPRGELKTINAELAYNHDSFQTWPRIFFIAAFLFVILSWIAPLSKTGRILSWVAIGLGSMGFFSLAYEIILRSMIRGWAPVTNLHETFLFISLGSFVLGLLVEFFNRNRIGLSVGIFTPAMLLFLAILFRRTDTSDDTLPPLVAVLRSNFWLSTHVTCVTFGYCAGLFAAIISHFWIVGQFCGLQTQDRNYYKKISGMAYGVALFSLLFSLVGTVLGGIWANYSWGRFWGWDPKENGALMIVLWTLVILHVRLGGYIRDLGLHVMMVLLGMIISFSWFGVNALGVGLHSYGFAAGIWKALFIFWGLEFIVLGMAIYIKVRDSAPTSTPPMAEAKA